MMVESGKAYSLKDLLDKFVLFASGFDEGVQIWINKRSDKNGKEITFEIPMKKWKNDSGDYPSFYLHFRHCEIGSGSYDNYYRMVTDVDNFSGMFAAYKEFGNNSYDGCSYSKRYLFDSRNLYSDLSYGSYSLHSKYSLDGYASLFKNTGEFIEVSLSTLFDEGLSMEEQGGSSCNCKGTPNLMSCVVTGTVLPGGGYAHLRKHSAEYPGTKTPWLTISSSEITNYDVANRGLDYWFTKTDYSATITFRASNNGADDDLYQSISFGMLDGVREDTYMFPLFISGGNVGLSPDIWVHNYYQARCSDYEQGNVYDLSMKNLALSNSNLLHPTQCFGATITNSMILSPSGEWKYITAHIQNATVRAYYGCNVTCIPGWGVTLEQPNDNLSFDSYNVMFPNMGRNARYTLDSYVPRERYVSYKHSSPLQRVLLFMSDTSSDKQTGCVGIIPNVYSSWYRSLPCGEISIGGRKFLSIPNGWDGRMWFYPYHVGSVVNNEWNQESLMAKHIDNNNPLKDYLIHDRLLIPLEGGS